MKGHFCETPYYLFIDISVPKNTMHSVNSIWNLANGDITINDLCQKITVAIYDVSKLSVSLCAIHLRLWWREHFPGRQYRAYA